MSAAAALPLREGASAVRVAALRSAHLVLQYYHFAAGDAAARAFFLSGLQGRASLRNGATTTGEQ
jgi:hypothetical protein